MFSIISLLVVLVFSVLLTRIATIVLTHTGLTRQTARFQARSAFTGVGFTTSESERIVNHPVRRKVMLLLMLLGNAGIITVIASFILSFVGEETGSILLNMTILVVGVAGLWTFAASSWVDKRLNNLVGRLLKKYTNLNVRDYESLLHLSGEYRVSEMYVDPQDWICDRRLAELQLRDEGIIVLGVVRTDGSYIGAPDGSTTVHSNDSLLLYGRAAAMENLDARRRGSVGEVEHRKMVHEQSEVSEEEESEESEGS